MKDFELLSHTADLKLRVYGTTIEELFVHALVGMFQAIEPQAPLCVVKNGRLHCSSLPITREIMLESDDLSSLLVDFLSEALYLSDVHNEAYLAATITITDEYRLKAVIHGVAITGFEVVEIKAVTYHNLVIKKTHDLWHVDVVFDI